MNESQLPYGLGSQSVLTNYISKHNRIMFSHLYNVSQFTDASPRIISWFLVESLCLKRGRYFYLFHVSGEEMRSREMKGPSKATQAVIGCAGLRPTSSVCPSMPRVLSASFGPGASAGQFPKWEFYWEAQKSQYRWTWNCGMVFMTVFQLLFIKHTHCYRRKKCYLFSAY